MRHKKQLSVLQRHLPFKSPVRARPVALVLERRVLGVAGVLLLGVMIAYSYFVMLSISHVVVREEVVKENELLANEVARLESTYLAHSAALTKNQALALGLAPARAPIFVERSSLSLSQNR